MSQSRGRTERFVRFVGLTSHAGRPAGDGSLTPIAGLEPLTVVRRVIAPRCSFARRSTTRADLRGLAGRLLIRRRSWGYPRTLRRLPSHIWVRRCLHRPGPTCLCPRQAGPIVFIEPGRFSFMICLRWAPVVCAVWLLGFAPVCGRPGLLFSRPTAFLPWASPLAGLWTSFWR